MLVDDRIVSDLLNQAILAQNHCEPITKIIERILINEDHTKDVRDSLRAVLAHVKFQDECLVMAKEICQTHFTNCRKEAEQKRLANG